MASCQVCGAEGVEWHENLRQFVNPITGAKHGFNVCLIKVPRFEPLPTYGITCYRSSVSIAAEIVKRCMSAGINPDKVRTKVEGEFVVIKP